jgi:hypothetical protein
VSAHFRIDVSAYLPAPRIQDVVLEPGGIRLSWTAPAEAKSFLVRVRRLPFDGALDELVVGERVRQTVLHTPRLEPGARYQAVVFALSEDVTKPGRAPHQFNVSVHDAAFVYDSATSGLLGSDLGVPAK